MSNPKLEAIITTILFVLEQVYYMILIVVMALLCIMVETIKACWCETYQQVRNIFWSFSNE